MSKHNSEKNSELINNNPQYQLSHDDRVKGGRSTSIKKSLAAQIRSDKQWNNGELYKNLSEIRESGSVKAYNDEVILALMKLKKQCEEGSLDERTQFYMSKNYLHSLLEYGKMRFSSFQPPEDDERVSVDALNRLLRRHRKLKDE